MAKSKKIVEVREVQKIRREILRVPNTPEGQFFLYLLRKFQVGGTRFKAYGRGPRPKRVVNGEVKMDLSYQSYLRQEDAAELALYLDKKGYLLEERECVRALWDRAYPRVQEVARG